MYIFKGVSVWKFSETHKNRGNTMKLHGLIALLVSSNREFLFVYLSIVKEASHSYSITLLVNNSVCFSKGKDFLTNNGKTQ